MLKSILITILFVIFTLNTCDSYEYKELYFNQYVDHFNFLSYGNKTYKQRYLLNDQWWSKGKGPIFFYTGNEGNIEGFWNNTGFVFDIAPKFKALIIFAEHRYYGLSLPFGQKSFQREYIGLLTIEQALADYAILLTTLKKSLGASNCSVIAFGGSYGGMLSAYMRFKYPHIVDGAIAASAPVYLVAGMGARDSFFPAVTKDFRDVSEMCAQRVRNAFSTLDSWAKQGPDGLLKISRTFQLCQPLRNSTDYKHLLLWARDAFTNIAMMDYPYATNFMAKLPANPVNVSCSKMMNSTTSVQGLKKIMDLIYNSSGNVKCNDIWTQFVECADPTGCGLGNDALAWDFQACTEIILPDGTNNKTDFFPVLPFTFEEREKYCLNKWGVVPRNDWLATEMFPKGLKSASNIVFSNGDLDPWRNGGINSDISSSVVAVLVKGGAHHLDLRGRNKDDPAGVIKARQIEVGYIGKWSKIKSNRLLL